MSVEHSPPLARTGIPGLDDVLGGGLHATRSFLIEGSPGAGKTTVALQFLLEGAENGERGLYITLSETEAELREGAASHGWHIGEQIDVFELIPPESLIDPDQQQSLLYSSDLELGETMKHMFDAVERANPKRIVVDSLSEIRLLAQSSLRYRRQILQLRHYFAGKGATVLLLDDLTSEASDRMVHTIVHGVIGLEQVTPDYGAQQRRLRIIKQRGQAFRGGYHDFVIRTGGVAVFPRLVAAEHHIAFSRDPLGSGIEGLDALLGGGVERGSSTLIMGPSGAGKSLFALQFIKQALERGERAAMFVFDEELNLLLDRAEVLGFPLREYRDEGRLHIEQVDVAELSPGEFAHRVRMKASEPRVRTVVIDSMNGYMIAMPEVTALLLHIHELLQSLNRQGTNTFVTLAQHGLVGEMHSPVDLSFLADTIVVLRYFEAQGQVRRAVSIIKKRSGAHETTIREFLIGARGLTLGAPLQAFDGVLLGTPRYRGEDQPLLAPEPPGDA
jgi:circadian clock protein KaiC